MKAFLSHSHRDKEFVHAVAQALGRQFCLVDEQAFETGEEFLKSIREGLDKSAIFVLFASQAALRSLYVNFEISEAEYRVVIQQHLQTALVFILDPSIEHEELPEWLRRAKIKRANAPKPVAREIRHHIDDIMRSRQQPLFIGRAREVSETQQKLIPSDGSPVPRVLVVSGLPGIGRRTMISRVAADVLDLKRSEVIRIESGDSMQDIALKLADRTEPYSTEEGLQRLAGAIRELDDNASLERILADLQTATGLGELPIFLDEGGLVDDGGHLYRHILDIASGVQSRNNAYLFLVSARRPTQESLALNTEIPSIQVRPLSVDETKLLIASISNRSGPQLSSQEIAQVAEYIKGFPPAAYYALQLMKDYGSALVLNEKSRLVAFRATSFVRYLRRLALRYEERLILQLLNTYSPLPLRVIGELLQAEPSHFSPQMLNDALMKLVDAALVIPDEYSYYWIADPITDAVSREIGSLASKYDGQIAECLKSYISEDASDTPILELSRVLYRALAASGAEHIEDRLHLASDWVRTTEELYHRRDYRLAIRFGEMAVQARPENIDARAYLIRALIQEERWDAAAEHITYLQDLGMAREAAFLAGFMYRKKGDNRKAIASYLDAWRQGRRGVALHRELGLCYFELGDLDNAQAHIDEAQRADLDNRYVVDLQIIIATRQGNKRLARERLETLRVIDAAPFYQHRLSTVEYVFHNYVAAYTAAKEAVAKSNNPTFEMRAQLIKCEIQLSDLESAEKHLHELDDAFQGTRRDARLSLKIRWMNAKGHWDEALALWARLEDKERPFYKVLRKEAIAGLLNGAALSDEIRHRYQDELAQLQNEVEGYTSADVDLDFDV